LVFKENSFALQIAVNDPNQIAQEFGLSVVVEYVMVAVDAKAYVLYNIRTKMALIPPLIEKCLASTRSGTRAKALEVLLLVVESEGSDFVIVNLC
jgi:cytoskeleton-associated protein 5